MTITGTKQELKGKVSADLLRQMEISGNPPEYVYSIEKYKGYFYAL